MKLKRQSRFHHEVSTSALNDIMFFLLLFFLIISTVANPQVMKLLLPESNSSESLNKNQISLEITAEKEYLVQEKKVPFEEVEGTLQAAIKGIEKPTVMLRIDRELPIQDLVDVLEIGNRLKVKVVLQTNKRK
jgi:biopolymer transport protein ExbD